MRTSPLLFVLAACSSKAPAPTPLDAIAVTETRALQGLRCEVQVLRTEGDRPHIYAHDRADLARALGFVMAKDRFFEMDLARRLGLGTVSELLGDAALETDMESRVMGMTFVADSLLARLTPEQVVEFDAFAEGVNAYILAVKAGELDPPSELELAGNLLGAEEPWMLMLPFDRRSVAGVGATLIYELGFETGDIGRANTAAALPSLYAEAPLGDLRRAGVVDDIWLRVEPVHAVGAAEGWPAAATAGPPAPPQHRGLTADPRVPREVLRRLNDRLDRLQRRLGHDWESGFGSNAWAVSADAASGGGAILAGDGHLSLTVPSLFYQLGLDTQLLGGGDTHQAGLGVPGMPLMAVGTNGLVAWNQTQLMGDITDWYREELILGEDGLPAATRFQGREEPVVSTMETWVVANVPLLGSEGRIETWARYTTFDGRWIAEIEGRSASADETLAPGEGLVNLGGSYVVPGDLDGDGVITALAFDYVGLDGGNPLAALNAMGHAGDVAELAEATRGLVAYSQNIVAADIHGDVLYTPYQAVPCRDQLPRGADGGWEDGANPSQLLDGTTYGGFTIKLDGWKVVEGDPAACVVPFDQMPRSLSPAAGFVVTANNDPAGITFDGDLLNEPWYIGGPWMEGYRAEIITRRLTEQVAAGGVTVESTAALQGESQSPLGIQFTADLLAAIDAARAASAAATAEEGSAESRLAALYEADPDRLDEAQARLEAWLAAGAPPPSGVETFYHQPAEGDDAHAVATTLFNGWFSRFQSAVLDDEGLPDVWEPTGGTGRSRAMTLFMRGRGPGNPEGLSSYNPETEESAFFDVLSTPEIETSDELAVKALIDALAFFESADGFGSADMAGWLWGYKHTVTFDSVLKDFLGDDPTYAALINPFSITTEQLPLAAEIPSSDPRSKLTGFPRPGDQYGVDAANPGWSGTSFSYGSGPVFRMVVELRPDGVSGLNILPGGQSAILESPYFDDQAALWLGNQAHPLRFSPEDVAAGATGRERYVPLTGGGACL